MTYDETMALLADMSNNIRDYVNAELVENIADRTSYFQHIFDELNDRVITLEDENIQLKNNLMDLQNKFKKSLDKQE